MSKEERLIKNNEVHLTQEESWRMRFAILTSLSTLFLIFAGGLVTSTGSGLSVPDWPLSFGMLFPPMVGGVFYEHGHRMIATMVGFFTLVLAIWMFRKEKREWARSLSLTALIIVILQGVLGGITVRYHLPTPVSVSHATLAQLFFLVTIVIAYSQTKAGRICSFSSGENRGFRKIVIVSTGLIFVQLVLGAIMRHTGSGLAIYDFPLAAGHVVPSFSSEMLKGINEWRFLNDFPAVTMQQVSFHFSHRVGAFLIIIAVLVMNYCAFQKERLSKHLRNLVYLVDFLLVLQIVLAALTVWTMLRRPYITSFHVATGAALFGLHALIILRSYEKPSLSK